MMTEHKLRYEANPYTGKPMYYKDNPEAVKKRDEKRMYVNGKEISKSHPLHKPGRYKSLDDAWSHNKIETVNEGEVYAITNKAWKGWVKIGKAVDSEDRLNNYQTSSPFRDYEIFITIKVNNRHEAEQFMHKLFNQYSKERKGEWFKISRDTTRELFNEYRNQINVA